MTLTTEKNKLLDQLVDSLKQVPGVAAIVLGGSHAMGMAGPDSDLDIGIYYHEESPFDIPQIRQLAESFHSGTGLTVTDFYGWGRWVNGGAWISHPVSEVDFIYRNLQQVQSTIQDALQGNWQRDYEQQPPFGFSSVIYLAETYYCVPLFDPAGVLKELKEELKTYPALLRQSVVQQSLWSATFTIWQAEKFSKKGDVYNTAGCITRALNNILSALFGLNEIYTMGDKYALQQIVQADRIPAGLGARVHSILNINPSDLTVSVNELVSLHQDTVQLAGNLYQPYFEL